MSQPDPSSNGSPNKASRPLRWGLGLGTGLFVALGGGVAAVATVPAVTARAVETVGPMVLPVERVDVAGARFDADFALTLAAPRAELESGAGGPAMRLAAKRVRMSGDCWGMLWRGERDPVAWAGAVAVDGGRLQGPRAGTHRPALAAHAIQLAAATPGGNGGRAASKPADAGAPSASAEGTTDGAPENAVAFSAQLTLAGVPFAVDAAVATAADPDGRRAVKATLRNAESRLTFDGTMGGGETLRLSGELDGKLAALPGGAPLTITADARVEGRQAALSNLELDAGKALRAHGDLDIDAAERAGITGEITLDRLQPSRLRRALGSGAGKDGGDAGTRDGRRNARRLPTGWVGAADVDVALNLPDLAAPGRLPGLPGSTARVTMDKKALKVTWAGPWAQGKLDAEAAVRAPAETDGLKLRASLAGEGLAAAAFTARAKGRVDATAEVTGTGATRRALRESLDGALRIAAPELAHTGGKATLRGFTLQTDALTRPADIAGELEAPRLGTVQLSGQMAPLAPLIRGRGRSLGGHLTATRNDAELRLDAGWDSTAGAQAEISLDVARVADLLGAAAPAAVAAQPLRVAGELVPGAQADTLRLRDAVLRLGETKLTGAGTIPRATPLDGAHLALRTETLALGPYLDSGQTDAGGADGDNGAASASAPGAENAGKPGRLRHPAAVLERLAALDVSVRLAADTVTLPGRPPLKAVKLDAAARRGALDLDLRRARLRGGAVTGAGYLAPASGEDDLRMAAALVATGLDPELPRGAWHGPVDVTVTADAQGGGLGDLRRDLAVRAHAEGDAVALTPPASVPAPPESVAVLPGIEMPAHGRNRAPFRATARWTGAKGGVDARLGPSGQPTVSVDLRLTPESEKPGLMLDGRIQLADLARFNARGRYGADWSEITVQSTPIPLARINELGVPAPKAGLGSVFVRLAAPKGKATASLDGALGVEGVRTRGPAPYDRIANADLELGATFAPDAATTLSGKVRVEGTHWAAISGEIGESGLDARLETVEPVPLDALVPAEAPATLGGTAQLTVDARRAGDGGTELAWQASATNGFLRYPGLREAVGVQGAKGTARIARGGLSYEGSLTTDPARIAVTFAPTANTQGPAGEQADAGAPESAGDHTLRLALAEAAPLSDFAALVPITKVPRQSRRVVSAQLRRGAVETLALRTTCPGQHPLVCLRKLGDGRALAADLRLADLRLRPVAGSRPVALDGLTARLREGTLTAELAAAEGDGAADGGKAGADTPASAIRKGRVEVQELFGAKPVASGRLRARLALSDLIAWAERRGRDIRDRLNLASAEGTVMLTAEGTRRFGTPAQTGEVTAEVVEAALKREDGGRVDLRGGTARLDWAEHGTLTGDLALERVGAKGWQASGEVALAADSGAPAKLRPTAVDLAGRFAPAFAERLGVDKLAWSDDAIGVTWQGEADATGRLAGEVALDGGDACLSWEMAAGPFDIKRCAKEALTGTAKLAVMPGARTWSVETGGLRLGDRILIADIDARGRLQPLEARATVDLAKIPLSWVRERAPQGWLPAIEGAVGGTVEIAWPLDWDAELNLGGLRTPGLLPAMDPAQGRVTASPRRVDASLATPSLGPDVGELNLEVTTQRRGAAGPRTHGRIALQRADARNILGARKPRADETAAEGAAGGAAGDADEPGLAAAWTRLDKRLQRLPVPRLPGQGHLRLRSTDIRVAGRKGPRTAGLDGALTWTDTRTRLAAEVAEQGAAADERTILLSTLATVRTDPNLISPRASLEASTSAIALDDLWRTVTGRGPDLNGRLEADLSLAGRWRDGIDALTGQLRMQGRDIDVRDARLLPAMFAAAKDRPEGDILDELRMDRVVARVMLRDGKLTADPLFAETPLGLAFAVLEVTPAEGKLAGRGSIKPLDSLTDWVNAIPVIGKTAQSVAETMEMPLRIGGTLEKVSVEIDEGETG